MQLLHEEGVTVLKGCKRNSKRPSVRPQHFSYAYWMGPSRAQVTTVLIRAHVTVNPLNHPGAARQSSTPDNLPREWTHAQRDLPSNLKVGNVFMSALPNICFNLKSSFSRSCWYSGPASTGAPDALLQKWAHENERHPLVCKIKILTPISSHYKNIHVVKTLFRRKLGVHVHFHPDVNMKFYIISQTIHLRLLSLKSRLHYSIMSSELSTCFCSNISPTIQQSHKPRRSTSHFILQVEKRAHYWTRVLKKPAFTKWLLKDLGGGPGTVD